MQLSVFKVNAMPEIIDLDTLAGLHDELRKIRFQNRASGVARIKTTHRTRTPEKEALLCKHRENVRDALPLKEEVRNGKLVLVLEL